MQIRIDTHRIKEFDSKFEGFFKQDQIDSSGLSSVLTSRPHGDGKITVITISDEYLNKLTPDQVAELKDFEAESEFGF